MPTKNTSATLPGADQLIDTAILRPTEEDWGDTTAGPATIITRGVQRTTDQRPTPEFLEKHRDGVVVIPLRYKRTPLIRFLFYGLPPGTKYTIEEVRYYPTGNTQGSGEPYKYFYQGVPRLIDEFGCATGKPWDLYNSPTGWPDRPGIYRFKLKVARGYVMVYALISYDSVPAPIWWTRSCLIYGRHLPGRVVGKARAKLGR